MKSYEISEDSRGLLEVEEDMEEFAEEQPGE
jgi:hypothetical protein